MAGSNDFVTSKGYIARAVFPFASISMFVLACTLNPIVPVGALTMALLGGLSVGTSIEFVMSHFYRTDLDKYFEDAGLCSKNKKLPKVLNRDENKETGEIQFKIKLPAGMSTKDLENDKLNIEQALGGSIKISFDGKYAFIDLTRKKLKSFYDYELVQTDKPLEVCIGYDLNGHVLLDLEDCPHLIVAGETGGGKSVFLKSWITSIIALKNNVELYLTDFQRVELGLFKQSSKVKGFCTTQTEFAQLLTKLKLESDRRLDLFEQKSGVNNISSYNNKTTKNKLPYIAVVVDEFASLGDKQYRHILDSLKLRVAQDRKCGISYILCSQRVSTDIIDGSVKCNIPSRIAFKTVDGTNSRIILDENGAEKLRGKGHGLLKTTGELREFQAMFISESKAISMIKDTFINKDDKQTNNKYSVVLNGGIKKNDYKARPKNPKVY